MATIVALKAARDFHDKKHETTNPDACMVGYASEQAHSCIGRAFDMLGICKDNLRKIKCNENYEMDLDALKAEIEKDRAFCHIPFAIIGSAGTVNTGAIDDLDGIADICEAQNLWFHVDGAFGATAILAKQAKARVLVRDPLLHRQAFARRPEYLRGKERGLAGGDFWAVDYGPELSRSFRALKVWTHIKTHGINAIKDVVERNIEQAQYLESIVKKSPKLEMLAPVPLNICCFRYKFETDSNSKNSEIVVNLQEDGIAAPSSTTVNDKLAIRVNLTNHRTVDQDLDILIDAVIKLGDRMTNKRA